MVFSSSSVGLVQGDMRLGDGGMDDRSSSQSHLSQGAAKQKHNAGLPSSDVGSLAPLHYYRIPGDPDRSLDPRKGSWTRMLGSNIGDRSTDNPLAPDSIAASVLGSRYNLLDDSAPFSGSDVTHGGSFSRAFHDVTGNILKGTGDATQAGIVRSGWNNPEGTIEARNVRQTAPIQTKTLESVQPGIYKQKRDELLGMREGFSAFGQQEILDTQQREWEDQSSGELQNARAIMAEFAKAQEELEKKQAEYVGLTESSLEYRNKFVKLGDGEYGYVTDRGGLRTVPGKEQLSEIANSRGCPSAVNVESQEVNKNMLFTAEKDNPLKVGGACPPSGVNVQIMGATRPENNIGSWEGQNYCYAEGDNSIFEKQDDISGDYKEVFSNCKIRAADHGRAAYSVYNNGDGFDCLISNETTKWSDVEAASRGKIPIITKEIDKVIFQKKVGSNIDGVKMRIMQNGQFVMGDNDQIEHGEHALSDEAVISGCNITEGAPIHVTEATVGRGCYLLPPTLDREEPSSGRGSGFSEPSSGRGGGSNGLGSNRGSNT